MIADNELSAILVAYSNATDDMAERMKSAIIESVKDSLSERLVARAELYHNPSHQQPTTAPC